MNREIVSRVIDLEEEEKPVTTVEYQGVFREQELVLKKIEIRLREEELEGQKQDRAQRKTFANKIFWLLVVFLAISLLILIASGFESFPFELSDTILITLLATTSANVIGIFLFVVRYLFKAPQACPHCGRSISWKAKIS